MQVLLRSADSVYAMLKATYDQKADFAHAYKA